MMKKLIFAALLACSVSVYSQWNLPVESPRQKVEQQFSLSEITVDYGRPGVKGRKVFGELVPFGKVWRAGANSATRITFGQNVLFGGREVKAGSYGLFVIPFEKEWKVFLNKDADQWGAYTYNEKLNVAETTVPVSNIADRQEWFQITVNPVDIHTAEIIFTWDHTRVRVEVKEAKPEVTAKIVERLSEIRKIEQDAASGK